MRMKTCDKDTLQAMEAVSQQHCVLGIKSDENNPQIQHVKYTDRCLCDMTSFPLDALGEL